MESSPTPTSTTYCVSRSRGKHPGESTFKARLREKRRSKGLRIHSSDESEPEDELESGAVIMHQLYNRKVVLYPDNTVVKFGKRTDLGEVAALRVAADAGLPVPHVRDTSTSSDGQRRISMGFIQGKTLDKLWSDMSVEQKKDFASQLRGLIEKMRSVPAPPNYIGGCDGIEIRDTRSFSTFHAPACCDKNAFNEFLILNLLERIPPVMRTAFSRQLQTGHRIVLSHCDLAPGNIIVKDGKIEGLIDWEVAGWCPEYWEYVKFFDCFSAGHDWKHYAGDIFPELYHEELVLFQAMSPWQKFA
ncbi:kinase-like domain-containing protein [Stachybotrys elegans]|uniref:Kinase-like domain-containing protein n=1 Tax=Stachybotrys elegans TaxID=80388 RepID=A0A8K0SRL6_9HYPO|nr:kinase-like domain-containing protein [Stachybotrys elegans]